MTSANNVSLAQRKNKVKAAQLVWHLDRIEREKQDEIRIHNTIKQRFKSKHAKLGSYSSKADDGSDVRMYETHNPGFCYRRNGECRLPQKTCSSPSVDYDALHNMLFTDDELDIGKVLCLHVLSAHRTETLTPPVKSTTYTPKDQCPVERLLDRSKKKPPEDQLVKMLPLYVIEAEEDMFDKRKGRKRDNVLINDGRLASRILVNVKLQAIVKTVLSALKASSPSKLKEIVSTAENTGRLQRILENQKIQAFVRELESQALVSSCESFYLTQPFKTIATTLRISADKARSLDHFVDCIRRNVLQFPTSNPTPPNKSIGESSFIMEKKNKELSSYANIPHSSSQLVSGKFSTTVSEKSNPSKRNREPFDVAGPSTEVTDSNEMLNKTDIDVIKPIQERDEDQLSQSSLSDSASILQYGRKDQTKRNILMMSKDIQYDELAKLLDKKTNRVMKRDLANLHKQEKEESEAPSESSQEDFPFSPALCTQHAKTSIRRSNCPACLEKWKEPLPSPKTPHTRKVDLPTLDQINYRTIKTNSIHMISTLIDRELSKVETSRTQERKKKYSSWRDMKEPKKVSKTVVEPIDLDLLDLAKINQEIREKETRQKLKKFLTEGKPKETAEE